MASGIYVRLLKGDNDNILMKSTYEVDFIESFKLAISSKYRTWEREGKVWIVGKEEYNNLLAFLNNYDGVKLENLYNTPQPQTTFSTTTALVEVEDIPKELLEALTGLYLTRAAPLLVAEAVYRALAKVYHPDHGDYADGEMFITINNHIGVIRRYLGDGE